MNVVKSYLVPLAVANCPICKSQLLYFVGEISEQSCLRCIKTNHEALERMKYHVKWEIRVRNTKIWFNWLYEDEKQAIQHECTIGEK